MNVIAGIGLAELSWVFSFACNQLMCPLMCRGSRREDVSLPHSLLYSLGLLSVYLLKEKEFQETEERNRRQLEA